MSMNILDCSHYTSVYGVDGLKGVGPLDWLYGIKLSYSVPDTGCDLCAKSGGTCGYDVETQGMVCICSNTLNSTRVCAAGSVAGFTGESHALSPLIQTFVLLLVVVYCLIPNGYVVCL